MHFSDFVALFETLLVLKKQYPIIFSYHKYLQTLDKQQQEHEMNAFVLWLGTNPQISKHILDNPKFASPSKGKTIYFDVVLKLADTKLTKTVWSTLKDLCKWVPNETSVNLVFNKLQHNSMVKELIADLDLEDVVGGADFDNLQIDDIDNMLFSPKLMPTLLKLRGVMATGKYDYKKFLPLIKSTINELKNAEGLEAGSRETLGVLDTELGNLTKGKQLNLDRVLTYIKQDPLVTQTSFSSFLDKFQ